MSTHVRLSISSAQSRKYWKNTFELHEEWQIYLQRIPGPKVIKLEFIIKLKIKSNDWLLADTCPQAANHCALFEFETVLIFCNLGARNMVIFY